jgi:hypothetical protein
MNAFLLDLVHDLKEKRLAPVAVVLVVALLAVPLVLMKPAAEDSGSAAPPQNAVSAGGAANSTIVKTVEGPGSGQSDLGVFDPKDPFKSTVKVKKPAASDGVAKLVNPLAAPSGGSSGGAPVDLKAGIPDKSVFDRGLTGSPPSSGGGGSAPTSPSPVVRRRVTKNYQYVVDLKFGATGDERVRKGVKRLAILPSDSNPLLVFLGVSADASRAVFLVDSTASQSGEGACRPSVKTCTFLSLRTNDDRNEQFVSDSNGREYHITLTGIRRVEIKRSSKSAKKARKAARRKVSVTTADGPKKTTVQFPVFGPDVIR